jgi:hypothetical protein
MFNGVPLPPLLESPPDFNRAEAEKQFKKLHAAIQIALGYNCAMHTGVTIQDASFHGEIIIPRAKWKDGYPINIRASNFNKLVCIQHEDDLPPKEREAIINVIKLLNYRYISFAEVSAKDLWLRYFDYL